MKVSKSLSNFFLSGAFSGYLPKMPGTYGSAVGLVLSYIIMFEGGLTEQPNNNMIILLILAFLFTIVSIPLINKVEKKDGLSDPSWIVIDEIVGMQIALCFPPIWYIWWLPILLFGVFRYFDILKPFPVSFADNRKGGFFVMLDDIIAGILTLMVGIAVVYLYRIYDYSILLSL